MHPNYNYNGLRTVEVLTWPSALACGVPGLIAIGLIPLTSWTQQLTPVAPAEQALAFDSVTVVDVEQGRLIPGQRVVIVGSRIWAVGDAKAVAMPKGTHVIDAQGKYLMPGLWDLHVHPRRYTDIFYPLLVAHGVTGIRDAGSEVPLDTLVELRRQILAGALPGPPRQLLAGPAIDERGGCQRSTTRGQIHTCVEDSDRDTADARRLVDSLAI